MGSRPTPQDVRRERSEDREHSDRSRSELGRDETVLLEAAISLRGPDRKRPGDGTLVGGRLCQPLGVLGGTGGRRDEAGVEGRARGAVRRDVADLPRGKTTGTQLHVETL